MLQIKRNTKIPNTNELVTKTQHDSNKQGLEKQIDHVYKNITINSGLFKETDYNTKINLKSLPNLKFKNTQECFWIQNWILKSMYKMYSIRFVKQLGCFTNFKNIDQNLL